jgi:hypothetical protein
VSPQQLVYAQKRRSTRIDQIVPIVVQGVGALREPYQEQVSTLSISCHGCVYQSKHEVIQGETVYLDVKMPNNSSAGCSSRARVKWAQKTVGKDKIYQIAVELEIAGNIWGVATPPTDWFPPRIAEPIDPATLTRELKVVARKEQQVAPSPGQAPVRVYRPASGDAAASPNATSGNLLAQLMLGLGEQIQTMAAEAAANALIHERTLLLQEFRAQLREEAVKAIHTAISASRDEIVRQATKELADAQEAATRHRHAQWRKQIEQDMDSARQHIVAQGMEVSQRVESLAVSTIERTQNKMDATRSEAVNRFVARIREQVSPMLEVAQDSLQKLEKGQAALKKESDVIFAELENQLAFSTNLSLAKAHEDLENNTATVIAKSNESLQKLFQSFENAARANMNALLVSAGNQMSKHLQDKSSEISREFTAGLEGHTRSYLESIGKAIAELTRKSPGRSNE